jgi:hypothetical protein
MRSSAACLCGAFAVRHRPNPHKIKARGGEPDGGHDAHFGADCANKAYFYAVSCVKPA